MKQKYIFTLLLISIFLLPRAGFVISEMLLPLPIGYIIVVVLVIKYFIGRVIIFKVNESKVYNPIARFFPFYLVISAYSFINSIIYKANTGVVFLELCFYVFSFFLYFVLVRIFAKDALIDLFIKGIIVISLLVSIYGLLVYFFGKSMLINYLTYNSTQTGAIGALEYYKRTLSSYGDPNALGAQLVIFCPILFMLLFSIKLSVFKRIFLLVTLLLNCACLLLTESRGALIGLGIAIIALIISKFRRSWFVVPAVISIVTLILIQPATFYESHRAFDEELIIGDERLNFGTLTKNIIVNIPLGVGFGVTMDDFNNIQVAHSIWNGYNSFYLQLLSKVGIPGVFLFLLMLFAMLKYFISNLKFIKDPLRRNFVFGASVGIIGSQVSWYANNIYMLPGGMLNFWMLCVMLTVIVSIEKREYLASQKNV